MVTLAAERPLTPWSITLTVLVTSLLLLVTALVKDRLASSPRYAVTNLRLQVDHLPPLLRDRTEALGLDEAILRAPVSIFDEGLTVQAVDHFSGRPWVKRVAGLTRRFPDRVEVALEVRTPLAIVAEGAERLAVDDEGVVLEHDSPLRPPEVPRIRTPGAPYTRVPNDGQAFRKDDPPRAAVCEALELLRFLRDYSGHPALATFRIEEVVVGEARAHREAGASDLVLRLDTGVEIFWGRSPLSPLQDLEPKKLKKLENLLLVLESYPGLLGVKRVDLTLDRPEVIPTMAPQPPR